MANDPKKMINIEDLVLLNEMCKRNKKLKRKKPLDQRAFASISDQTHDDFDDEPFETLIDKGIEPDRIIGVTTMDNLDLMICYLMRYKSGEMELIPNKIAHRLCPLLVIEFLESRLVFTEKGKGPAEIPKTMFQGVDDKESDSDIEEDDNEKNVDGEDIYTLDELSKFMNMDDILSMISSGDKDTDMDMSEQSSPNDLFVQKDISEIKGSPTNSPHRNIVEIDEENNQDDFEKEEFKNSCDLFDKKFDEPEIDDHNEIDNIDINSSLDDINFTLSMSQKDKVDQNNDGSPDLLLSSQLSHDLLNDIIDTPKTSRQVSSPSLVEIPETQKIDTDQLSFIQINDTNESIEI